MGAETPALLRSITPIAHVDSCFSVALSVTSVAFTGGREPAGGGHLAGVTSAQSSDSRKQSTRTVDAVSNLADYLARGENGGRVTPLVAG